MRLSLSRARVALRRALRQRKRTHHHRKVTLASQARLYPEWRQPAWLNQMARWVAWDCGLPFAFPGEQTPRVSAIYRKG